MRMYEILELKEDMPERPIVRVLENGQEYELVKPFRMRIYNAIMEVPAGFVTDFASVPRVFWRLVPPFGRYIPASIIHDYLYVHHRNLRIKRQEADAIFLHLMLRLKCPRWKSYLMWLAVRLGGGPGLFREWK